MDVRGPSGLLVYNGRGEFAIRKDKKSEPKLSSYKKISMIGGGMISHYNACYLCSEYSTLTDDGLYKAVCLPLALMTSFVSELSYPQLIVGWEVVVSGMGPLMLGVGLGSLVPWVIRRVTI